MYPAAWQAGDRHTGSQQPAADLLLPWPALASCCMHGKSNGTHDMLADMSPSACPALPCQHRMHDIYNIKWNKLLGQGCFAHVIKARCYKEGTLHGLKVSWLQPVKASQQYAWRMAPQLYQWCNAPVPDPGLTQHLLHRDMPPVHYDYTAVHVAHTASGWPQ